MSANDEGCIHIRRPIDSEPFAFLEEVYGRLILAPVHPLSLFEREGRRKLVEGGLLIFVVQEFNTREPPVPTLSPTRITTYRTVVLPNCFWPIGAS